MNRTTRQNNSLHLYLRMLAEALNDAGKDMKYVLKDDVDIPWNEGMAKEFLWRPLQEVILDKASTTELDTDECDKVFRVLHRHMAEKHGVNVPWPSWTDKE